MTELVCLVLPVLAFALVTGRGWTGAAVLASVAGAVVLGWRRIRRADRAATDIDTVKNYRARQDAFARAAHQDPPRRCSHPCCKPSPIPTRFDHGGEP